MQRRTYLFLRGSRYSCTDHGNGNGNQPEGSRKHFIGFLNMSLLQTFLIYWCLYFSRIPGGLARTLDTQYIRPCGGGVDPGLDPTFKNNRIRIRLKKKPYGWIIVRDQWFMDHGCGSGWRWFGSCPDPKKRYPTFKKNLIWSATQDTFTFFLRGVFTSDFL